LICDIPLSLYYSSDKYKPALLKKAVSIRRIQESDIPGIRRIEEEVFPDPWGDEVLRETVEMFSATSFIAETSDCIAGFIICGIEDTGEELYGHICNLAVSEQYRNCGIGQQLLKRAEHQLIITCATGCQLEVRVSNTDAQSFYRKMGYQPVFHLGAYYANTEDAIVMMKWFTRV